MLGANRILEAGGFGIFYTAVLVITIAMSPMVAVTLVLVRRFADMNATVGSMHAKSVTHRILVLCLTRGAAVALIFGGVLSIVGFRFGIEAWQVMLLIPATVLALAATEIIRTFFQSALQFAWASTLWIVSQASQLVLAILGLLLTGQVWVGVAGVFLGAALTAFVFGRMAHNVPGVESNEETIQLLRELGHEFPMILSYSLFILFNNIDILLAYLILPRAALDVYAASALLPKAIITATFPIAQVVLPVIVAQRLSDMSFRLSIVKAIGMVIGLASVAAVILWLAVPLIQNTSIAIRGLEFDTMVVLSVGAIGVGALRVLIVIELALRRSAFGLSQVMAIALFVATCFYIEPSIANIAKSYVWVTWAWLVSVIIVVVALVRANRSDKNRSRLA